MLLLVQTLFEVCLLEYVIQTISSGFYKHYLTKLSESVSRSLLNMCSGKISADNILS